MEEETRNDNEVTIEIEEVMYFTSEEESETDEIQDGIRSNLQSAGSRKGSVSISRNQGFL